MTRPAPAAPATAAAIVRRYNSGMTISALLDLHIKSDALEQAPAALSDVLATTRAFDGCLGVDVLIDNADPTHFVVVESWASLEHDSAYRAFRQTPAGASALGRLLAEAPTLTICTKSDI